jgi:hypothetical protein
VVCGRNAISQLGIANGTRGTVTALDPEARTLTIRVDARDPKEVTLPAWYLDGRGRGERNRRIDLAYATTGHRAQGLTMWRALVRLTGSEDANWLYVQLSRARRTPGCMRWSAPNPKGRPSWTCPTERSATATPSSPRRFPAPATSGWRSTRRAPWTCGGCPPESSGRNATGCAPCWTRPPGTGPGSWRGPQRIGPRPSRSWSSSPAGTDRRVRAAECLGCFGTVNGPLPTPGGGGGPPASRPSPRQRTGAAPAPAAPGRRAWRQAAAAVEDYRRAYHVTDPETALGPVRREPARRATWQQARQAVQRVRGRQRTTDRTRQQRA